MIPGFGTIRETAPPGEHLNSVGQVEGNMNTMGHSPLNIASYLIERDARLSEARIRGAREQTENGSKGRYRFLTITRDEGSLGNAVAQELARHLEWKVFDKEIVNYIAQNSHVRENLVRQLDEKSQSIVEDTILRFLRMPEGQSFGSEEYHAALLRTLAAIAAQGEAVILGRGSNVALHGDEHGLHVRITASPEIRAERLAQVWKSDMAEARRRIKEGDAERRNFLRHYFRQELDDPRFYDLVFNTDRLSMERVAAAVLQVMDGGFEAGPKPPWRRSS
jgi:cytidylate kinase